MVRNRTNIAEEIRNPTEIENKLVLAHLFLTFQDFKMFRPGDSSPENFFYRNLNILFSDETLKHCWVAVFNPKTTLFTLEFYILKAKLIAQGQTDFYLIDFQFR